MESENSMGLSNKIHEYFGLHSGISDYGAILKNIYPNFTSKLKGLNLGDLETKLLDVAETLKLNKNDVINLSNKIKSIYEQGFDLLVRAPDKIYHKVNISRETVSNDLKKYCEYLQDLTKEYDLGQIVMFERDMDCITTATEQCEKLPDIKRIILTRDEFGGKCSKFYTNITKIVLQSKKEAEDKGGKEYFKKIVSEKMKKYIFNNIHKSLYLWTSKVAPYINSNQTTLFVDIGWKGGMQYWCAGMYELLNENNNAHVSLIYTKNNGDEDALRGFVETPSNYFKENELYLFFLKNNANEIPRLLKAENKQRKVIEFTKSNFNQFSDAIIRQYIYANC